MAQYFSVTDVIMLQATKFNEYQNAYMHCNYIAFAIIWTDIMSNN